jgi:prolyl oligopeptidase
MKILFASALFASLAFACQAGWDYPPTKTVDVTDTYFGKTYTDPYRWLENLKDKETEAWFKAQAELTDRLLAKIPAREALVEEWMGLDKLKPATYGDIAYESGRFFYKKTLGGENVGKLCFREGWGGPEKLLFDPGAYKAGVVTTIESILPSWDGKYVLLGFSSGGAEYSELRVLDVASDTLLPDSMYPSMGPTGWAPDSKSFFYDMGKVTDIRSPEIELNRKTKWHKLGAAVASDTDIFSNESDPELKISAKEMPSAGIPESYPDYIVGSVGTVQNEMRIFYARASELNNGKIKWDALCQPSDNLVRGFEFHNQSIYAITHTDAPKYKVVRTSVRHPDWAHAETVVPEASDSIEAIVKTPHYLLIVYSNGVTGRLVKYDFGSGKTSEVKLPLSGTLSVECPDWKSDRCLVSITSWTVPRKTYDYDAENDTFAQSAFDSSATYPGFENLVSEEVEAPSYDGTMVPLSIIHQKGIPMDGSHSCILEGYGAYGNSYTPYFSVRYSLAKRGIVLAFAHVRGGSEKGEAWYKAGFKTTKPNTWKDFIACAEYLVKQGYTSPAKLGGTGTSAGGILISRAITDRPDLFGAAICNVGCADALRLEFSPNGPVNTPEFGTVADPAECQALYEMDGVQHVRQGVKYPAVMGVAGWNDPRVAPWQPGKFIAALQRASASGKPALLKVNYDNGHFTEEKIVTFKNFAGQAAFLLWQTGHPDFQPAK